jgi:hypothetical protein
MRAESAATNEPVVVESRRTAEVARHARTRVVMVAGTNHDART